MKRTGAGKLNTTPFAGSRRDAERALTAILAELDSGSYVAPSALTVAEFLTDWLVTARDRLAPKTAERYDEICRHQILPFLGAVRLQALKPPQIGAWHRQLRTAGGAGGKPLAAQTVKHAHRVLHSALEHAVRTEILSRNPAHSVPTPKVRAPEMAIVEATEIESLFARLAGHRLYPIVLLAFSTGARRGELLALRWSDLDLEIGTVNIARSVEETREGLRIKPTKTGASRIISLPADAVAMLRDHRRRQSEDRFRLGLGAAGPRDLVFSDDGLTMSPDTIKQGLVACGRNIGFASGSVSWLAAHSRVVVDRLRARCRGGVSPSRSLDTGNDVAGLRAFVQSSGDRSGGGAGDRASVAPRWRIALTEEAVRSPRGAEVRRRHTDW